MLPRNITKPELSNYVYEFLSELLDETYAEELANVLSENMSIDELDIFLPWLKEIKNPEYLHKIYLVLVQIDWHKTNYELIFLKTIFESEDLLNSMVRLVSSHRLVPYQNQVTKYLKLLLQINELKPDNVLLIQFKEEYAYDLYKFLSKAYHEEILENLTYGQIVDKINDDLEFINLINTLSFNVNQEMRHKLWKLYDYHYIPKEADIYKDTKPKVVNLSHYPTINNYMLFTQPNVQKPRYASDTAEETPIQIQNARLMYKLYYQHS